MDRRKIVEKLEQAEQENLNTKPKRAVVAVYWILRLIVIAVMVMTVIHKDYESTFVCVLVLILFMLPRFVERNFRIELPSTLEIIILVFIFAAEILGELKSYFITYPHWDTVLHTTTGFISAAFGFALVDLLNRNKPQHFKLSPVFLALVAFCFSMTVGVLWEFFEFSMDYLFHMDMQKDTVIHAFASVTLDPTNSNHGRRRQRSVARPRRVSGRRPVRHDGGPVRQLHRCAHVQHHRLLQRQVRQE